MKNIAVFASGNGSNFEAIANYFRDSDNVEVKMLIASSNKAYALERANNLNIESYVFDINEYESKVEMEIEIANLLNMRKIDLVVLAGYMRIIGNTLLEAFPNKIINIHPSLLPSFRGKDALPRAYEYGVKVFGITVHYIDSGIDTGKIISQRSYEPDQDETLESITSKIHELEHELYPETIKMLMEE